MTDPVPGMTETKAPPDAPDRGGPLAACAASLRFPRTRRGSGDPRGSNQHIISSARAQASTSPMSVRTSVSKACFTAYECIPRDPRRRRSEAVPCAVRNRRTSAFSRRAFTLVRRRIGW